MGPIEKAIKDFCNSRRKVYENDPRQIQRDTNSAESVAKDHVGRWFFELFQNSDDAEASEVLVIVTPSAIYIADVGNGLKSEAVESICGTYYSNKTAGTIGRKGVGFKAVYEISDNPQVFTENGEGIEFSREKTRQWLCANKFCSKNIPFQWIPFFVSRCEVEHNDPVLNELQPYKTVVKLKLRQIPADGLEKAVRTLSWDSHALLAFRNVARLEVRSRGANSITPYTLEVKREGEIWRLEDSRAGSACWRVEKHCEQPPEESVAELSDDDKERVRKDEVGFLVAAPLDENGIVKTTEDYLPLHVFYRTEQTGPVRLLLHAEFLVKGDRTEIIPIDSSPFNRWVGERLADYTCEFVQGAYSEDNPSSNVPLLVPFDDRETHPVAGPLWELIKRTAQETLMLGDVDGKARLRIKDAKMISVSVDKDKARYILEATDERQYLLHHTFDGNDKTKKALKALECKELRDDDLIQIISANALDMPDNREWLWSCWEWLADWVAKQPSYSSEYKDRIRVVQRLPIVPVDNRVRKMSELAGHIVTWRAGDTQNEFPGWLPLTYVDDWFRDRASGLTANTGDNLEKLLNQLDIKGPDDDVLLRALAKAIEHYWKNPEGECRPAKFLMYILEQDWHETQDSKDLKKCPVPVIREGSQTITWARADTAYFGEKWGNNHLAVLYKDNPDVPWVQAIDSNADIEKQRGVLEWLGCSPYPRVVEGRKHTCLRDSPEYYRDFIRKSRDPCGRMANTIDSIDILDKLDVGNIDLVHAVALICLLSKYWDNYRPKIDITAHGRTESERNDRHWRVKAMWWYQVLYELKIPQKQTYSPQKLLKECWLPNKRTERAIGELLPIVDLDVFRDDRDVVAKWLREEVEVKERKEQVSVQEWSRLLSEVIPGSISAEQVADNERDKITGWYEACIETMAEQENMRTNVFASCPLLCRKGEAWEYVGHQEKRYLADDQEYATAFSDDVWLLDIASAKRNLAAKLFGIPALSDSVHLDVVWGGPEEQLDSDLKTAFDKTLVWCV